MPSASIKKTACDPAKRILSVRSVASGKRYEFAGCPRRPTRRFERTFQRVALSMTTFAITSGIVAFQVMTIPDERAWRPLLGQRC